MVVGVERKGRVETHVFFVKSSIVQKVRTLLSVVAFLIVRFPAFTQSTLSLADSIRRAYQIPELGYAVVSSSQVLELQVIGVKKAGATRLAEPTDKFRIGSNTKAITGFIAAQLVKEKKINWNTRFFDLFPELKAQSKRAYYKVTLLDLLTFRTRLIPYTYTNDVPARDQFTGDETQQRAQFTAWFFQQEPVKGKKGLHFSNLGYVAAGQMLEKVSGKSYKELVTDLGMQLDIHFGFGNPNSVDTLQPWGHGIGLIPEAPGDNYKLDWLLPAGNIHVNLPDYCKFVQLQLKGLAGQSELLPKEEFQFLHYGLPEFAVGWFLGTDENNQTFSYNVGNPGTFLTKVFVFKDLDRAIVLFANAQTPDADAGLDVLYGALKGKYLR